MGNHLIKIIRVLAKPQLWGIIELLMDLTFLVSLSNDVGEEKHQNHLDRKKKISFCSFYLIKIVLPGQIMIRRLK